MSHSPNALPLARRLAAGATTVGTVITLALLAACDEPPTAAGAPGAAPPRAAVVATGGAVRYPTSRKYADHGAQPATGRSGTATLVTRTTRLKDGSTRGMLSTGDIDIVGNSTGTLERVQVKIFGAGKAVRQVTNLDALPDTDRLRIVLPPLARRTAVQYQANIGDLHVAPNDARTGVVTVLDTVWNAPDVTVQAVEAPAEVAAGSTINVTGVVRELNGDLGAWKRCTLLVDGTIVDQMYGLTWIDAGGVVSCVFTHRFDAAGTHQLTVSVDVTIPRDYDQSNNARSASITVSEAPQLAYSAWARDVTTFDSTTGSYRYAALDGSMGDEGENLNVTHSRYQDAALHADTRATLGFPEAPLTDVRLRQVSGDVTLEYTTFDVLPADWMDSQPGWVNGCVSRATNGASWVYICSTRQTIDGQTFSNTTVDYTHFAGDVTYRSEGYQHHWDRAQGIDDYYTFNNSGGYSDGVFFPIAGDYRLRLRFVDGGTLFQTLAVMAMEPFLFEQEMPYTCNDASDGSWEWHSCSGGLYREVGLSGATSGGLPLP